MNKKLSIITINYNNLEGLKRTVESVVSQTWQEFEYIVIDGGSTDGSSTYIESQSSKIDYWVSEPDKGIYNAMNKGIAKATGEYLLFLNSGDHFYNESVLEKNHTFLVEKDLIYFNLNISDRITASIRNYPEELSFTYLVSNTLPHPATFIHTSIFNQIGLYDEDLNIVSDWKLFIISICKYNYSYKKIDETLTTFYLDGISSKSENTALIYQEREKVLMNEFPAFIEDNHELIYLRSVVSNLRKSNKILCLIKLGLLDKF